MKMRNILAVCLVTFFLGCAYGINFSKEAIRFSAIAVMKQIEDAKDEQTQKRLIIHMTRAFGPVQTIELLNASALPKAGASHLLAHTVGETAFQMYGDRALAYCEEDERSGCSHGLLIAAAGKVGFPGIAKMVAKCKEWSFFRYTMCLHAAGHAFLALYAYDIHPALARCDELIDRGKTEIRHCYNGVFMENAHGVHGGLIPPQHPYLKADNLKYPCSVIADIYKKSCWGNTPGYWFADVFHYDLDKTLAACKNVPEEYYPECVDNIARVIMTVDKNDPQKMTQSCNKFDKPYDSQCLRSIASSLTSQGDEQGAIGMCLLISDKTVKKTCYEKLLFDYKLREISARAVKEHCSHFEKEFQYLCNNSN